MAYFMFVEDPWTQWDFLVFFFCKCPGYKGNLVTATVQKM